MTIGSLFSGIGGLELGLERAGLGPVLWQCEIEPFCRAVLAKHWPGVTRYEDVTRPRTYPNVDIVCGGFPCQDVSSSGKRRGLGGEKSSLWWHFASVVAQVAPRIVLVENVTSGKVLWLPHVRHTLHLLGYDTLALGIAARDVGAPHRRERVFVVAHANRDTIGLPARGRSGARRTGASLARNDGPNGALADPGTHRRRSQLFPFAAEEEEHRATCDGRRSGASERGVAERRRWAPEPAVGRVADGVSGRLDGRRRRASLRALGNAVVPQCAEVAGRVIQSLLSSSVAEPKR